MLNEALEMIQTQKTVISSQKRELEDARTELVNLRTNPIGTLIARESARQGPPRETMFSKPAPVAAPAPKPAPKPAPAAEAPHVDRFSLIDLD
jgi:hypothetical protein